MEFNKALEIYERCKGCEYEHDIRANGDWWFKGCRHEPYKGMWIVEIANCPKERKTDE